MRTSTTAPVELAFLDTNVLVYAYDRSAPHQQRRARAVPAVARLNQVAVALSEDFSHGAEIDGVRFVNPFVGNTP